MAKNEEKNKLFERFGEFDSAEEINEAAEGMKVEGDLDGIRILAKENGLDLYDAEDYIEGETDTLTTVLLAADGKLDVEATAAKLPEEILITDWISYIRAEAADDETMCRAIRRKGKSLIGCIGAIMAEAFRNQWNVPEGIRKASGVNAGRVTFGVPSMGKTKEIIRNYYMEGGHAEEGA